MCGAAALSLRPRLQDHLWCLESDVQEKDAILEFWIVPNADHDGWCAARVTLPGRGGDLVRTPPLHPFYLWGGDVPGQRQCNSHERCLTCPTATLRHGTRRICAAQTHCAPPCSCRSYPPVWVVVGATRFRHDIPTAT
jgi:hypothetical protein